MTHELCRRCGEPKHRLMTDCKWIQEQAKKSLEHHKPSPRELAEKIVAELKKWDSVEIRVDEIAIHVAAMIIEQEMGK